MRVTTISENQCLCHLGTAATAVCLSLVMKALHSFGMSGTNDPTAQTGEPKYSLNLSGGGSMCLQNIDTHLPDYMVSQSTHCNLSCGDSMCLKNIDTHLPDYMVSQNIHCNLSGSGSMCLQNTDTHLPDYMVSQTRRPQSELFITTIFTHIQDENFFPSHWLQ
jgi:hypothetical protein